MLYSTWQVAVKKKIHQPVEILGGDAGPNALYHLCRPALAAIRPESYRILQSVESIVQLAGSYCRKSPACRSFMQLAAAIQPEADDSAL